METPFFVSIHLLLCVLIFGTTLPGFHTQPDLDITQVTIASISSDGTCVDRFPYALICSLPSRLTFRLAGLPFITNPLTILVVIDGGDAEVSFSATSLRNDTSTVVGVLYFGGYSLGLMGRILSVSLYNYATGDSSELFHGLYLISLPPPLVTSVSGCQGSGVSTVLCDPDHDVLTFQGSGLSFFRGLSSFMITVGNSTGILYGAIGHQVIGNGMLLIPLNTSFSLFAQAIHFTGQLLPLSFNLGWYTTLPYQQWHPYPINAQSISFAALPPPTVFSVVSRQCTQINAFIYIGCEPVTGSIQFNGHYFYNAIVTLTAPGLGSFGCRADVSALSAPSTTAVVCYLPLIPSDTNGQVWDVTITTPAGRLNYPGLVTFSTATLLAFLVACNMNARQPLIDSLYYLNCQPSATLTIRVSASPPILPSPSPFLRPPPSASPSMCVFVALCCRPYHLDLPDPNYRSTAVVQLLRPRFAGQRHIPFHRRNDQVHHRQHHRLARVPHAD